MKSIYLGILKIVFKFLPLSRFFRLKTYLLQKQGIIIDSTTRVFSTVQIFGPNYIKIGSDTFIGHETLINGSYKSKVIIGSNVDISHRVTISTGSHEIDMQNDHTAGIGIFEDIIIEDGAWIGMNSIILPGVTIGEKSIVAAGSVVIKSVPPYTIVAGNPATIKKRYDVKKEKWIKNENL